MVCAEKLCFPFHLPSNFIFVQVFFVFIPCLLFLQTLRFLLSHLYTFSTLLREYSSHFNFRHCIWLYPSFSFFFFLFSFIAPSALFCSNSFFVFIPLIFLHRFLCILFSITLLFQLAQLFHLRLCSRFYHILYISTVK